MARRKSLSDAGVDALPTKAKRYTFPDPEFPCLYIRVTPTGAKSYVVVTNNKWTTIGSTSTFTIEQAREEARKIMHAVATGKAAPESFESVTSKWLEQHVIKKQLRSLRNIDRHIKRLNAKFGGRDFASVRRAEIMNFVDGLIELHGECQADQALTTFGAISNWYALRNEDYASPIVRGMRVYAAAEHARARILSDEEIRTLWAEQGPFADFIKILLLTGQRRAKVAKLRWNDIDANGVWTIATEAREKRNPGALRLPQVALDIVNRQVRYASNDYVFAARAGAHMSFSHPKLMLDRKLNFPPWVLHDLRRTARSLMSRAGVRPDIAERTLGHTIKGVEQIYDRHSYAEEKKHALVALAGLIETIVTPPTGNVIALANRG